MAQSMEFELDDADFLAAAALVAAPAADEEAAEAAEQLGDDFDNAVALLHGGRRRPLGFNRRSAACAKHARACKAQSVLVLQEAQVERRLAAVTDRFAGGGGDIIVFYIVKQPWFTVMQHCVIVVVHG